MSLTPQEMQELAELEELEALEAEEAMHASRGPAVAPREAKSKAESAAAGVTQGLTFGYGPQITAGLATLGGKLQDLIRGKVIDPKTGQPIPRVDYITARDATAEQIAQAQEDNPMTFIAGNVAGALPAARVTGGLAAGASTAMGRIGAASGLAAAEGAVYNPGDEKGQMGGLQLGERAGNAGLAALLGFGGSAAGELVRKGAKTSNMVGLVKDESKLMDESANRIQGAIKALNERVIDPADKKVRELLRGKSAVLDLDEFRPLEPKMIDELEMKAPRAYEAKPVAGTGVRHVNPEPKLVPQPDKVIPGEAGGTFPREPVFETVMVPNPNKIADGIEMIPQRRMVPGSDRVTVQPRAAEAIPQPPVSIPQAPVAERVAPIMQQVAKGYQVDGEDILNLRQALDAGKTWKPGLALDTPAVAAREAKANKANQLRSVLSQLEPAIEEPLAQASQALRGRGILERNLRSPIEALQANDASTKGAVLSKIDQAAGTNLREFGRDVQTAKALLVEPKNLVHPLKTWGEQLKMLVRGAAATSKQADKLPTGTNPALIKVLLEQKRR